MQQRQHQWKALLDFRCLMADCRCHPRQKGRQQPRQKRRGLQAWGERGLSLDRGEGGAGGGHELAAEGFVERPVLIGLYRLHLTTLGIRFAGSQVRWDGGVSLDSTRPLQSVEGDGAVGAVEGDCRKDLPFVCQIVEADALALFVDEVLQSSLVEVQFAPNDVAFVDLTRCPVGLLVHAMEAVGGGAGLADALPDRSAVV